MGNVWFKLGEIIVWLLSLAMGAGAGILVFALFGSIMKED